MRTGKGFGTEDEVETRECFGGGEEHLRTRSGLKVGDWAVRVGNPGLVRASWQGSVGRSGRGSPH